MKQGYGLFAACGLTLIWTLLVPADAFANPAVQPVPRPDNANWVRLHAQHKQIAGQQQVDLVFLGDSITQAWSGRGRQTWEQYYAPRNATNFGISGDRTEHVLYRIDDGIFDNIRPKLIVIMIGTNNIGHGSSTPEQASQGVKAIIDRLQTKLPDTRILLLGVFPRAQQPDHPQRQAVHAINELIQPFADWDKVHFLDIGHVFLEDDGTISPQVMPDFLHLQPEAYALWAQAIEFKVAQLMGEEDERSVTLFDGESLAGWTDPQGNTNVQGWTAEDGLLKVTGRGPDLATAEEFGDFDFEVEWQIEPGANSGIFYRWSRYQAGMLGPEYQIIDDARFNLPPDGISSTASNYAIYEPAANKPLRPAGQWNHTRIVARGSHVEHWLNGVRVIAFEEGSDDWQERVGRSKFRNWRDFATEPSRTGRFLLQNYQGNRIAYRNFKLRVLNDENAE